MFNLIFSIIAKLVCLLFMIAIVFMVVGFFRIMFNGRGNDSSNNLGDSSMWVNSCRQQTSTRSAQLGFGFSTAPAT